MDLADDTEKKREKILNLIQLNREYQDALLVFVGHADAAKKRNLELQVITLEWKIDK